VLVGSLPTAAKKLFKIWGRLQDAKQQTYKVLHGCMPGGRPYRFFTPVANRQTCLPAGRIEEASSDPINCTG